MATKGKKPAAKKTAPTKTTVTRIVADDTKKAASTDAIKVAAPKNAATITKKPTKKVTQKTVDTTDATAKKPNVFTAIGGYFAGAWYELKQVSWPNRKATWSLTAAMIAFTGFFVVLILLLDALFKYLFELMLG